MKRLPSLDNRLATTSIMLQWLPTTGRVRPLRNLRRLLTSTRRWRREWADTSRYSREDAQEATGDTNAIENSQIRLTDGSNVFTPNLFGPGITVEDVTYEMATVDAGIKYKGLSLEGEYYWRWLRDSRRHQHSGYR